VLHIGRKAEGYRLARADQGLSLSESCVEISLPFSRSVDQTNQLTWEDLCHVHQTGLATDMETAWSTIAQRADKGEEQDSGGL